MTLKKKKKKQLGTVFCTWGSTAGPCPANLCKELTWGTLMGTAVIVPKVCWKKNSWKWFKTMAQLSQVNFALPSNSFSSSLSLPLTCGRRVYHGSSFGALTPCKSHSSFSLTISSKHCSLKPAFSSPQVLTVSAKDMPHYCEVFLEHVANTTVQPWLKAV